MIDHEQKQLRLIDWGLAEFYHPGKEYAAVPVQSGALQPFAHLSSSFTKRMSTQTRIQPVCMQAVTVSHEHTRQDSSLHI